MNWQLIAEQVESATGRAFKVQSAQAHAGGDINSAFRLQGLDQSYFVKLNRADLAFMFEAEFAGLEELARTQTLRVPTPVVCGQSEGHSFLVLEYLEFGHSNPSSERILGERLAQLHRQPQPFFGWYRNNTIGSTPQHNNKSDDWLSFWRDRRLGFQLELAAQNSYGGKLQASGERLRSDMDVLFGNYRPSPSLLHGDLWAGNAAVDSKGCPVIFDPACYYGDREADLAMTELFGGFGRDFYAAYQSTWPLDRGYTTRKTLYNLYHILNHLNLFAGGYLRQAENSIAMLLAEIS